MALAGGEAVAGDIVMPVFCDSVSDTDGAFILSNRTVPRSDVYYEGRFTNAPGVWQDHLAATPGAGISVVNYGVGGATTCHYEGLREFQPGLSQSTTITPIQWQVDKWIAEFEGEAKPNGSKVIPTIVVGHPADLLIKYRLANATRAALVPTDFVHCLLNATARLLQTPGVSAVIVANMAATDLMPAVLERGGDYLASVRSFLDDFDFALGAGVATLNDVLVATGRRAAVWDWRSVMADVAKRPKKYGMKVAGKWTCVKYDKNATGPSLAGSTPTSMCTDPDAYVWYDDLHPSSRTHKVLADSLLEFVRALPK